MQLFVLCGQCSTGLTSWISRHNRPQCFFLQTTTIQITDNQGMRQSLRSLGFLFQKKFQFIFKIDFLLSEWRGQNGDKIIIISAGGGAEKQQQITSKSIGNKRRSLHSSKGGLHSGGVR